MANRDRHTILWTSGQKHVIKTEFTISEKTPATFIFKWEPSPQGQLFSSEVTQNSDTKVFVQASFMNEIFLFPLSPP